jgi:hypothetical protein
MAATTLYLNDQSWRRADGNHAVVRVYVGPLANYGQPLAVFVDGVAVITDAALANKVVELGIARRIP